MYFAIRDDDTSPWTNSKDLNKVYRPFWDVGIPVSFSVIPFCVETHHWGNPEKFWQKSKAAMRGFNDNKELMDLLRKLMKDGLVEINQHGSDHLYSFWVRGEQGFHYAVKSRLDVARHRYGGEKIKWLGECLWKPMAVLRQDLAAGKYYLEKIFNCKIKVFVPPSNMLSVGAVEAIDELGMNISGGLGLHWRWDYLWFALTHRGQPFPCPIKTDNHYELGFYSLGPTTSWESLKTQFDRCKKWDAPFVVATHYWEFKFHPRMGVLLKKIVNYALKNQATPTILSRCFN